MSLLGFIKATISRYTRREWREWREWLQPSLRTYSHLYTIAGIIFNTRVTLCLTPQLYTVPTALRVLFLIPVMFRWGHMFLYAFCHPERSVSAVGGSDRDEKSIVIAWSATPPTPTIAPPYTRCFDYAQHDKSAHTPPSSCGYIKVYPQPHHKHPLSLTPTVSWVLFLIPVMLNGWCGW